MHRNIKILAVLILLIIQSSSCFGQLDSLSLIHSLTAYIESKSIPGAMISIVTADSSIFIGGVGYANIEKKERVTAEHLFRQGSISKSFTALGMLKALQADKEYHLDTPIKDIDPAIPFQNQWSTTHPVRIVHLLEHTSGFDDFHLHSMYNKSDATPPPVSKMILRHKKSLTTRWRPGFKKAYSNPNYIVAGHLLEKLSGQSYHRFLYDSIVNPIGMKSSAFYFKAPEGKKMVQGYNFNGQSNTPISFTSITGGPAGEFCSNATDMAVYLQFMLHKNADTLSLPATVFDRIENPATTISASKGLAYGYGLGNYSIWKNGYLFHGHGGGIDGFSSRYVYSRTANIGIAVAINREGNSNAIVDEILDLILGVQKEAPANRKVEQIPIALQEQFTGFYEFNSPRNALLSFSDKMLAGLILDFDTDKLITKTILGKVRDTMYYAGNNQFYRNLEGVPSAMLLESEDGEAVFWVNDNYTEKKSRIRRLIIFFGLLISILLVFLFLIYSLIWFISRLFSKNKKSILNHLSLSLVGLCFVFMFLGFGLSVEDRLNADSINFNSLLMYFSSFGIVSLTVVSVFRCFKLPPQKGFRFFYSTTTIAAILISLYLLDIGFIGLKLWSY